MKIVKYIVNLILSFLLILIIISMIALNLVSTKILDKNYVLSKLEETEFYLQVSREVQSGFEKYIYQSGLPEDTIKDLYTQEMLTSDVNTIIDYIYEGTEIKTSEDKVRETLDTRIKDYLKSEGKIATSEVQENIKKFEDLITKQYKANIRVSDVAYNTVQKAIRQAKSIYEKIRYLPMIGFVIIIILLIVINRKDLLLGINFASISLLSVGVLFKLAQYSVFKNVDVDNLVIFATSISNFVINMMKELLYTISDYGTWFIICGITGIIITAILKNMEDKEENKHKKKSKH